MFLMHQLGTIGLGTEGHLELRQQLLNPAHWVLKQGASFERA